MQKDGLVYLVGAGPGDVQLITVKGRECIEDADVILYDRLVNPSLLIHAKVDAELIYVGKSPGKHTMKQKEINELLVQKAKEGKSVVRLKGGDAFVFGRGGEEAEKLSEHNIPFEVVPGISSAYAVPAYAGIPVTHRKMASSFAVITGHKAKDKTQIGWKSDNQKLSTDYTNVDTLIFLMGVKNLPVIVENLLESGYSDSVPVSLIQWGTTSQQKTLVGVLGNIVETAKRENFVSPAVIVVGGVVILRDKLAWFEKKPLFGKRIVITRPRHQAGSMAKLVTALGGEPFLFPTIEIVPPVNFSQMDEAIEKIERYDWIVFTSVNGVDAFFKRMNTLNKDIRMLSGTYFCCIGRKTEAAVQRFCLNVDYVPQEYTTEAIIQGLKVRLKKGERVLLPRTPQAPDILTKKLKEMGFSVDEVVAYRTVKPRVNIERVKEFFTKQGIDILTFTSSSTVKNFLSLMNDISEFDELFKNVIVACIGPVTSQTAKDLGIPVHIVAKEYTVEGLIDAIVEYVESEK